MTRDDLDRARNSAQDATTLALVAEVERLRGLISSLPSMGSIGYACPWCCAQANKTHESDCQAFTPDGEVK